MISDIDIFMHSLSASENIFKIISATASASGHVKFLPLGQIDSISFASHYTQEKLYYLSVAWYGSAHLKT